MGTSSSDSGGDSANDFLGHATCEVWGAGPGLHAPSPELRFWQEWQECSILEREQEKGEMGSGLDTRKRQGPVKGILGPDSLPD